MPTGYTADIKDGISFKTFAMNCARAFGACVELRDESGGGEVIPERFEPSDYHQKAESAARQQLAAFESLAPSDHERGAAKAFDDSETRRAVRLQEIADLRAKYEAMLAKARAWEPPTPEHVNYRAFMIDQLQSSINFDCDASYYSTPTPKQTGAEWAEQERARLSRDVEYHQREYGKEVTRAADRTAWVQALRSSLQD